MGSRASQGHGLKVTGSGHFLHLRWPPGIYCYLFESLPSALTANFHFFFFLMVVDWETK
jgi:hypothetical protein